MSQSAKKQPYAPITTGGNQSAVVPAPPWWRGDWKLALLLVAAVFIAYQQVWRAGFIWDDDAHLTANPCIVGPLGFPAIWTSAAAVYYPLVLTSFWLQHALWGLNPIPYHLVNIAMHAACAILLWRVLLALGVRGAWLGAALWALHPVMVESAAWITELKNTQSCFFYLLAILFFLRWRNIQAASANHAAGGSYALVLLCAALAILSKSSTVMLPVVLALCAWWMQRGWPPWRVAARLVPIFLISLVAGGWTVWEQKFSSGALGRAWEQSWPERILIAGNALWFYLGKLAWPHPLIFIYPRWNIDPTRPLAWLPVLAAAVALFILWRGRNARLRPLFFAAAYFVVSLFPVLGFFNVYFFRYSFVGDHFQYLASMSPLALAGAGLATIFESLRIKWIPPALSASLLVALGFLTWNQCAMYANVETLWQTTTARNPGCWMAHNNLGLALFQRGRTQEAIAQYREALRIDPAFADAQSNLGNALLRQGRTAEAVACYREALRIDPAFPGAHYNLGNVLLQQGRTKEAIAHYREALRVNLAFAEAQSNLGDALLRQGQTGEAVAHYREALRIDPADPETHYNLANALLRQGSVGEAIARYGEALRIDPDYVNAHNNLGAVLLQQGRTGEAIAQYQEVVRINPAFAEARYNLGNALLRQGRSEEAIGQFRQALELQPANVAIQNSLAWSLATAPQPSLRDDARALQLALRASQSTGGDDPLILRTLAAAYAGTGDFPRAVQTAQKALQLAEARSNTPLAGALRRELKLYQAGRPFEDAL